MMRNGRESRTYCVACELFDSDPSEDAGEDAVAAAARPTLADPKALARAIADAANAAEDEEEDDDWLLQGAPSSSSASSASQSASAKPSPARGFRAGQDPAPRGQELSDKSEALGRSLLMGWRMLAESCPVEGCCSPLMRDKNGNEVCVQPGCPGPAAAACDDCDCEAEAEPQAAPEPRAPPLKRPRVPQPAGAAERADLCAAATVAETPPKIAAAKGWPRPFDRRVISNQISLNSERVGGDRCSGE